MTKTKTTLSGDDYFGNIPNELSGFLVMPRIAIHKTGRSTWAHPANAALTPHSHLIREDWPVDFKNQLAQHIEDFHKPRRRVL